MLNASTVNAQFGPGNGHWGGGDGDGDGDGWRACGWWNSNDDCGDSNNGDDDSDSSNPINPSANYLSASETDKTMKIITIHAVLASLVWVLYVLCSVFKYTPH